MKYLLYFSDHAIHTRHALLLNTVGVLHMEIEAYNKAFTFSWIFFPIVIMLALLQLVFFTLYNNQLHPMRKILDGVYIKTSDTSKQLIINYVLVLS